MQTNVKCSMKGKHLIGHAGECADGICLPNNQCRAFPHRPRQLACFAGKGGCHD